jgi:hypothetical protein
MKNWRFRSEKGEEVHPASFIFPLTSLYTPNEPYEVIGTGFLILKPGTFLTARHCLYNSQGDPWTDFTGLVPDDSGFKALSMKWLIVFANTDLAIGQLEMNDLDFNHKVVALSKRQPKQNEEIAHWGCDKSEIELVQTEGNKDTLTGQYKVQPYEGKFEGYHPCGISISKWPCYQTTAEFPNAASGGPVSDATGRVFAINSTSSEGGGYSTAVLIKNVLESNVPGHYLINDGRREQDMTFGDVLRLYGAEVLEE